VHPGRPSQPAALRRDQQRLELSYPLPAPNSRRLSLARIDKLGAAAAAKRELVHIQRSHGLAAGTIWALEAGLHTADRSWQQYETQLLLSGAFRVAGGQHDDRAGEAELARAQDLDSDPAVCLRPAAHERRAIEGRVWPDEIRDYDGGDVVDEASPSSVCRLSA
jgi:hypothetical protein